nr:MAG TPA: hypothetical protein [Caudoviricetes sp.]
MDEMFGGLSIHTKNYINFMVDMAVEKANYDPKKAAEALIELRKSLGTDEERDFADFSYEILKMERGYYNE